jgi:hypothetical protein
MELLRKPFKSFVTSDKVTVSEGNEIEFTTILGEVFTGVVVKIGAKAITIHTEGSLGLEVWGMDTIADKGIKVINQ